MTALELIAKRLAELEAESARGQQQLTELRQAVANTEHSLVLIQGAMIALSELQKELSAEPPAPTE